MQCESEILFVGQLDESDDRPITSSYAHADTTEAALDYLRSGQGTPELIVLAQTRPGEFTSRAVDLLRRAAPLARFERVAGSWCEGEQRSGQPPAGCANFYWHHWPARFARELARARSNFCASWAIPPTATVDERLLRDSSEPMTHGTGMVIICAKRSSNAGAIGQACRIAGYTPRVVREDCQWQAAGARAVVWDTTPETLGDDERVRTIRAAADAAPLVAVVGFPRHEDCQAAREHGVAAVVSKPFAIRDLLDELAKVIKTSARMSI